MRTDLNWHERFIQQASWTATLRKYLYKQTDLAHASCLLEVGCGTGAILSELPNFTLAELHGLDINRSRIEEACVNAKEAICIQGNANSLPYPSHLFDISYCHYLLLWVKEPVRVLNEMQRVTRHGGSVLVMAEPDYSHRVDQPREMEALGELQTRSLVKQGADPTIGLKLDKLFELAKIHVVESGVLQQESTCRWNLRDWELEWKVFHSDLVELIPESKLASLKQADLKAWMNGTRMMHVPTYFAWGRV